jgi:2-succinyl-6-hydroxy-2,4-cyclohexadiene-1-carboxylate synthase
MLVRLADLTLHVARRGQGPPLVLLHGFTGSAAQWGEALDRLANGHDVCAIDLIGHGLSDAPRAAARYGFEACITDLTRTLDALGLRRAHLLGYSMGGRLALGFTVRHRDRVDHLVLESASPGIADEQERDARRLHDEMLADQIERDGVGRFVEGWMAQPLFASQRDLPPERLGAARRLRERNRPHGLANSLRGMSAGMQPAFWDALADLHVPTLLVVGERDAKFRRIADSMAARLPRARTIQIDGAGHATHFERPAAFVDAVTRFLSGAEGPAATWTIGCDESANRRSVR